MPDVLAKNTPDTNTSGYQIFLPEKNLAINYKT